MPHAGTWHEGGVREEAEDLNQPLLVGLARAASRPRTWRRSAATASPRRLGALKAAEDGDGLILRVYEPAGARGRFALRLPEGWRDAGAGRSARTDEPRRKPKAGSSPFEVRSWRLRRG